MPNKNTKRISMVVSNLDDWEILSVCNLCNKILNKSTLEYREEFKDLCFFIFDGNEQETIQSLEKAKKLYSDEYFRRRCN